MRDVVGQISVTHTAILLLTRTYFSGQPDEGLVTALKHARPEHLARVAQNNHVHALVGKVLVENQELISTVPRDLFLYFRSMHEANATRLTQAKQQLYSIHQALSQADVPAVVMKGGGDALDPLHKDSAIRFVGDLDILIPQELVGPAKDALLGIGAESPPTATSSANSDLNWRGTRIVQHHLPKIIHADWELPLELHTAVGRGTMDRLLPARDVLSRAQETSLPGLYIMSPEDRACHLISHTLYHYGTFDLRSWIDWTSLRSRCDIKKVNAHLTQFGMETVVAEFEAMATYLTQRAQKDTSICDNPHVDEAILRFGSTRSRKIQYAPQLIARKSRALLRSPEYRNHILKQVIHLSWWRDFFRTHATIFRNLR
jgi:hypothetical protein